MKHLKGLHTDSQPIDQPQGTYRNALNALINKKIGAISSEEGNIQREDLTGLPSSLANYTLIGDSLVYDGRHILFFAEDGGTNSEIGTFDGTSYTQIIRDSSLNFSSTSNIEAVNIINNQNEVVVYWTDDINPPRFYNIDEGDAITDINTLNIFPTIQDAPRITLDQVNPTGGQLLSGAYHFAIALYSEDNSRTNYMSVTPPVYINDDSDVADHDTYDGVVAGTQTSKSIRLNINNLDTNYNEFELVVIRKEGGTIAEVSKIPRQSLSSTNSVFNYTGNEETTTSSLDEILINTAVYETAKTIEEQDNTLYMGNLTKKPDIGYQRYANNIKIESVVEDLDDGGDGLQERDHYGNPTLSFYDKSFKRGEVYAFYISFVLENGQDSKAYHIPGRVSEGTEENDTGDYIRYQLFGDKGTNNMGFWENVDETYPDTDDFDVYDVDVNGDPDPTGTDIRTQNVRHHRFPDAPEAGMSFWDGDFNDRYAKKLGIKVSDIKIPSNIIDRVRGVKIHYAKRDESNQIILDQGIGVPMKYVENPPADQGERAWMYYRGTGNAASDSNASDGIIFDSFNALRTRKNIGSATYVKEVGQPEGPSFSDGDGDPEQVFFDMTEQMYYGGGATYPIKAITYLEHASYVSGVSKGFSYNIDNTEAEEGMAIEFGDSFQASWDGAGEPWNARNVEADLSQTAVGRVFELAQILDNVYFPFDQQELVWTGFQSNDIDLFDPRTTGGVSGTQASGSLDVTGDSNAAGDYAEAVLSIDVTQPAEGHIEVTANNIEGTEDHTVSVDGNSAAPVTINGLPEFIQSLDISTQSVDPDSIFFRDDGSTFYVLSRTGDEVDEYAMSSAWDLTTATYTDSLDVSPQDNDPDGIFIGNSGMKLYITGDQNDNVYEYDLGTAWDVSTATFNQSFDISTETTNPAGLHFKADGTMMFVLSNVDANIYSYDLSVAWDISTAAVADTADVSGQDTDMDALHFKPDGTKLFTLGKTNDNLYEYDVGTAWDITTLSFVTSYDVSTEDGEADGLYVKPDGTQIFIGGRVNDNIYEYLTPVAWTLDSADTIEEIVTKYRDAINGDGTISTDWTATIEDQGGGTWRTIITANTNGTAFNGDIIDVTGETDVVLTTQNTTGGQDTAQAGDVSVQINAAHDLFTISTTLSGGETTDQVVNALASALNNELVFSLFYTATPDTGADTVTITAVSNGTYLNRDIVLNTDTTNITFTKDGEIDGGTDTGSLDFLQSIGYIEVVSVDTTGTIDVSFPIAPAILVNVNVDTGDTLAQTAQNIVTSLEAATQLDSMDFFAYEEKVYYYDAGDSEFDGDEATVADDTGSITANTVPVANGRESDGEFDTLSVIVSTPAFADSLDVTITPGDNAATVENAILTALQGWAPFTSLFSATGTDPISVTADNVGTQYNGALDIDPKGTGITFTANNLTGGTNADATDFTLEAVYGGDTFIALYGTRRSMWDTDGDDEAFRHLIYFPCESQDNIKLRHAGENYEEIYYPKATYDEIISLELDKPSGYEDVTTFNNYIAYNPDYSADATIKTPIPFSKNQVNIESYPTRVIRSAEGDETEGDLGIRTFLENDFLDLTKSKGELVKLSVLQNILMCHMERSLIRTKGREELTTGDFRAFLGAGDIFSVKPDEILSTDTGFAGLQDPRSAIVTPFGYFFVDRDARKVFLVNDSPKEISSAGLRNFFEEELSNFDPNNDKLLATWDDKWDRILLTYIDGVTATNSWTLSYYPKLEIWGSFHSYTPEYYLQGLNTFYSLTSDIIYEHNDGDNSCLFNGVTEDFIFEFVDNRSPNRSKYFANIEFITEVVDESVDPPQNFFKETFNQFRIKNAYQDSGDTTITYFDQANGNARNVEGTWKINKFRDLLVSGVIDNNKPWQDRSRLIGKYAQVELIYNNSDNKFLYLHDAKVGMRVSKR